jgi:hypothetical protein
MPQYTFRIDPAPAGEPESVTQILENDEVAVHVARRMLGAQRACMRVGRGAGEAIEWLGAWEAQSRHAAWRNEG